MQSIVGRGTSYEIYWNWLKHKPGQLSRFFFIWHSERKLHLCDFHSKILPCRWQLCMSNYLLFILIVILAKRLSMSALSSISALLSSISRNGSHRGISYAQRLISRAVALNKAHILTSFPFNQPWSKTKAAQHTALT